MMQKAGLQQRERSLTCRPAICLQRLQPNKSEPVLTTQRIISMLSAV